MNAAPRIGWVGLGSMGSRMAPNLVNGGFSVTGFDLDRSRTASAATQGLHEAPSLSMLASESDVLFSMIPNDQAFLDVVRHICGTGKAGACLVDMSTISPEVSVRGAALLDGCGMSYLRAPVSGSTTLAAAGTLSIWVSGPESIFQLRRPLIALLGKKITYLGAHEEARIMKLVVNVIVAAINTSLAEALNLGRRSGLDWATMIDAINDSAVASPYIASKAQKLKERDWSPAATVEVIAKDIDLALELARQRGAFLPSAALTRQILSAIEGKGRGQLDMSCIATFFE
jgi:3-hydroxyisobutyrate dehydrogenase-like beta-hydroxyacid dehydrogenase